MVNCTVVYCEGGVNVQSFSDYNCSGGISRISLLLSRLTLLRPFETYSPFSLLLKLLHTLNEGDVLSSVAVYHELTAELIKSPSRRVSGDIWRDYLLWLIIETPHEFARAAASGTHDEPLYASMRSDLAILGVLSTLTSDDICRFVLEKQQGSKGRTHTDNIALSSASAWSGVPVRQPASSTKSLTVQSLLSHAVNEADILTWNYDNAGMEDEYVCDETLEELYHRFAQSTDWRPLAEDLWSFFASYGCGNFIKYKSFSYDSRGLLPMPKLMQKEGLEPVSFYEMQHRKVLEHTISFMQGSSAENILITGGAATGKTELVLSIAYELPELRLVICSDENVRLSELFDLLSKQPLRFMVLLDNISFCQNISSLEARRLVPKNVLLAATSRGNAENALFSVNVTMPYPTLNDFVDIVAELLADYDVSVSKEAIHSKCIDCQAKEKLTLSAAKRIADDYIIEF